MKEYKDSVIFKAVLEALRIDIEAKAYLIPRPLAKKRLEKLLEGLPAVTQGELTSDRAHRRTILNIYTKL